MQTNGPDKTPGIGRINPAVSADPPSLPELLKGLLRWHKALIIVEQHRYEYAFHDYKVANTGELTELVLNDPWFAWLRPVTSLIVDVDVALEHGAVKPERHQEIVDKVRELVNSPDDGERFGANLQACLNSDRDGAEDACIATEELAKLVG
jgi:hypothetical protein